MLFRYTGASPRPIDRIESILNSDRKVATYKLALLRALCDIALTAYSSVEWNADGRVGIALDDIAERWTRYYWPLVESPRFLPQINGEAKGSKPIAFRVAFGKLISHYRKLGGLPAFLHETTQGPLDPGPRALYRATLTKVRATIVKGPVEYAGGALGERAFHFDKVSGRVLLDANLWRELCLMGHWIRDAVILRWAEMTARLSGTEVPVGMILDLLLKPNEPPRADQAVRDVFASQRDLTCVWSDAPLRTTFEVDHAIPFALWQDSSTWNLFPSSRSINNAKRDRLPTRAIIRKREEAIISTWRLMANAFPYRFQRGVRHPDGLKKPGRHRPGKPVLGRTAHGQLRGSDRVHGHRSKRRPVGTVERGGGEWQDFLTKTS